MKPKKPQSGFLTKDLKVTRVTKITFNMSSAALRLYFYCISLRRPGDDMLSEQIEYLIR